MAVNASAIPSETLYISLLMMTERRLFIAGLCLCMLRKSPPICFIELHCAYDEFHASSGWLHNFKECHNICFKNICGETSAVDHEVVDSKL